MNKKLLKLLISKIFILFFHKKPMADINLPSGAGGLVRFKEEYASMFNLKPTHVILFIVLIVAFRISLNFIK
jgi:hypothetical protein